MDNVRILKGYSNAEQRELEEAKDNGFLSSMTLIHGIGDDDDDCHSLSKKYYRENPNENEQMARDIADFYTGKAKFADKKYYVHLIKGDENSYLNITSDGGAELDNKFEFGGWQTKFTRDEVVGIDPKLVPFMEEV